MNDIKNNDEIINSFHVSDLRKQVWAKETFLLETFHNFCLKNDLKYWAIGGTLLGAIRHNGFIPWDDDIDVAMPREDYDRMKELAEKTDFGNDVFFQSENTDPNYIINNVRFRHNNTTAIRESDLSWKIKYNRGIWLSVFPFDNIPDDFNKRKKHIKSVSRVQKILFYSTYGKVSKSASAKRNLFVIFSKIICLFIGRKRLFRLHTKRCLKFNKLDCKEFGQVSTFYESGKSSVFKKEWFTKTVPHKFENIEVMVPYRYLDYLSEKYGNWQKYIIGISAHGNVFYDSENSFEKYVKDEAKLKSIFKIYKL